MDIDEENEVFTEERQEGNVHKRRKLFSCKEFRQKLSVDSEVLPALKEFIKLSAESDTLDCVLEYLECGGSCLEILQLLEKQTKVPPIFVIEVAKNIILRILSHFPQHQLKAEEASRYLLNNHISIINRMLGLKSSVRERKAILKLLTVIVSLSASLAKDVLVHVTFNRDVLDLNTKPNISSNNSVRVHFIHFLIAFLIDGHWPTISGLLEKRGLLTSIVHYLQFDSAETVCMVVTAFKTHILENTAVSKTVKMHTFSTHVLRDLVNLYNWKGVANYDNKTKTAVTNPKIDVIEKDKVYEVVHPFLLLLCTSHKYGVVFRDHYVGQGKASKNNLLTTVLEHLERPWDHSLAGELVIKICYACPDLVKNVWLNMKPFLEPRPTKKWLMAIDFAQQLLENLQPSCIQSSFKELNTQQLYHVILSLVAPTHILRTIYLNNFEYESSFVKYRCIIFFTRVLDSLNLYLSSCREWLSAEHLKKMQNLFNEYIFKHLPSAKNLMNNWDEIHEPSDSSDFTSCSALENLNAVIELLHFYDTMCPQLSSNLSVTISLQDLLNKIDNIYDLIQTKNALSIKMIKLYANVDPALFSFEKDVFKQILPILVQNFVSDGSEEVMKILEKIFLESNVFDGCSYEIRIWIRSILCVKSLDCTNFSDFLINVLTDTRNSLPQCLLEIANIKQKLISSDTIEAVDDYDELLKNLKEYNVSHSMAKNVHVHLSPLILGALKVSKDNELHKSVLQYLNINFVLLMHTQTDPLLLMNIVSDNKYADIVLPSIKTYFKNLMTLGDGILPIKKPFSSSNFMVTFSEALINNNINEQLFENHPLNINDTLELAHMGLFYFSQMAKCKKLVPENVHVYVDFFKNVLNIRSVDKEVILALILNHPIVLSNFSPIALFKNDVYGMCTKFIITILKEPEIQDLLNNIIYLLSPFRTKILRAILKIIKHHKTTNLSIANNSLMNVMGVFGLTVAETTEVIERISKIDETAFIWNENSLSVVYEMLIYCLKQFNSFYNINDPLHPLVPEIISKLTKIFVNLEKRHAELNLENFALSLKEYLDHYRHNVENVDPDLFSVLLQKNAVHKNYFLLAIFLLEQNHMLLDIFYKNLECVSSKKYLLLALTKVAISKNASTSDLQNIYGNFEHNILKVLTKPHKAGTHFEEFYPTVVSLICNCMPNDKCLTFVNKLHKYDSSEVFHVHLLIAIYEKIFFSSQSVNEKHLANAILTLIHIHLNLLKRMPDEANTEKIDIIANIFKEFLVKIIANEECNGYTFDILVDNESLKLFTKFCLKYGLSGQTNLLKILGLLNRLLNVKETDATICMEMILSHSEFLELILGGNCASKTAALELVLILCEKYPSVMSRSHIPIWLSAYHASLLLSDRLILNILRRYENASDRTNFHDFKPYLWGQKASNHYSLLSDVQNTLWRQPRSGDVLDILNGPQILKTVKYFPINRLLNCSDCNEYANGAEIYDPSFLLPLFNLLLAPESDIPTYKFTKSGAISIIVSSLSSNDKNIRLAACNVLARLHFHLDAKRHGKDKLLWLRFVEIVCKGTAVLRDTKLGSFAALFLSRMALILTEPMNHLYVPLSQYLSAREAPNLSGIPEIYTLLHSSDVNFREHRKFILEILQDGLRVEADLHVMLHSMAFKFIMDSLTSIVTDDDTNLLVLQVICKACKLSQGMKLLLSGYGLFPWLFSLVQDLQQTNVEVIQQIIVFCTLFSASIVNLNESYAHMFNLIVLSLLKKIHYLNIDDVHLLDFLKILCLRVDKYPEAITNEHLEYLINLFGTNYCYYLLKFGSGFVENPDKLIVNDINDAMKKLTLKYLFKNQ